MCDVEIGQLHVNGTPASEILKMLDKDERLGAVVLNHVGGDAIVYPHIWTPGLEPTKMNLSIFDRWGIKRGNWGLWDFQVNRPDGSFMASSERSRDAAIQKAKEYIEVGEPNA